MPTAGDSDITYEDYRTALPISEPTKVSAILPLTEFLEDVNVSKFKDSIHKFGCAHKWLTESRKRFRKLEAKIQSQDTYSTGRVRSDQILHT